MGEVKGTNSRNNTLLGKTEDLFNNAKLMLEIRDEVNSKIPGEDYDIFSVLDVDTSELFHCRFIYDLLSPHGQHNMGDQFLRAFIDILPKSEHSIRVENVNVYREYVIPQMDNGEGRIDLLIEGDGICLPIEVKIFASDQNRQIERYWEYASSGNRGKKFHKVYYLTLQGDTPSESSTGKCKEGREWECISFSNHIIDWLEECGGLAWNSPKLLWAIKQYRDLIEQLTGSIEEDRFMAHIQDDIKSSKENFEAAMAIARSLGEVQISKMTSFFNDLQNRIAEFAAKENMTSNIELIRSYENKASKKFYDRYGPFGRARYREWPGIIYKLPKTKWNGFTLGILLEIDFCLNLGLICLDSNDKMISGKIPDIKEMFDSDSWIRQVENKGNSGWIWLINAPRKEMKLDFVNCNGAYLDLYDHDKYEIILNGICEMFIASVRSIEENGLPSADLPPLKY